MALAEITATDPIVPASIRTSFGRYSESLLRAVAGPLIRPRNQWPADEVRERTLDALGDPVLVDRTLKTLSKPARQLLRLIGMSRQSRWRVRALVDLLNALGCDEGVGPIQELLENGLLFPDLPAKGSALASFGEWLQNAAVAPLTVMAVPLAASRARSQDLGIPVPPHEALPLAAPQEADGLEWPLRLAVFWQLLRSASMRRTQQGGYFKRDFDRLRGHPLLSAPPAEAVGAVPDPGLFAASLAQAEGVAIADADQIRAGELPEPWRDGLNATLVSLWSALVTVDDWDPLRGWTGEPTAGRTFAATAVLALGLLATVPEGAWVRVADAGAWLDQGPDAVAGAGAAFLLGLGHQLRLVQATRHRDEWWVRLSPFGRALAEGAKKLPAERPAVEQTLIVQPNLEIVLFRQGVTPGLIARLSHIAEWKALGLACTLALTSESVYHGLESGETVADIVALLERHGTRGLSETVLGSLRSWASKRERVLVFPAALLLEFRTPAELDRAVREGLVERRVTDRIGLIAAEDRIAYQQFRLVGSRDYVAPEEHCVEVADDGLTLAVNEHKSDLLLDSELRRFAEPTPFAGPDERPRFRMTPATLRAAQRHGWDAAILDNWFLRRTGEPLSATAKLLLSGEGTPPLSLENLIVLRVPGAELADGIMSWTETRGLIAERLAPRLLAVPAEAVEALRAKLAELGVRVDDA
jgi:hypothetical protein